MMGDHFNDPVVIIKAAWGGHSLVKLFRSPSAGLPSDEKLQEVFDSVEGKGFFEFCKRFAHNPLGPRKDYTLWGAREWLKDVEGTSEEDVSSCSCYQIYGQGGWNRYFVRKDGSIEFSVSHGTKEAAEKAKAVGFKLFE
jgi:hypothetical protein